MIAKTNRSVTYSRWLTNIVDTHRFQSWNKESTDADEREEEELNDSWAELDDAEKQRLWGLSADLYTLRDQEKWVDSDWPPMSEEELRSAQAEAFQAEEWDKLLEYLRRPPRFRLQATVDYMRGRAWQEMGHPDVALLFFDNAVRLDPSNPGYAEVALECLKAIRDWPEILRRFEAYMLDSTTPPRLLFRAADALRSYANQSGERRYYQDGVRAVDEGFARLQRSGGPEMSATHVASAYATKSLCLEHLGETQASLQVVNEAVAKFPHDTLLLIVRGLVKQQLGGADALVDFRNAVTEGSDIALPYIEVARDAVQAGRNQEAIDLSRKGLAIARRSTDKSRLLELLAISSSRLDVSADSVRQVFESAAELDPLSEQIRANSEMFERFLASHETQEPNWQLAQTPPRIAISHLQPAA